MATRKKRGASSTDLPPAKRAKKTEVEEPTIALVDANAAFTLEFERCNSWSIYKTGVNRIQKALVHAYPKAKIEHNPKGKPRKGSFEVTLVPDPATSDKKSSKSTAPTEALLIYSKLDEYGPSKNRDWIATAEQILEKLAKYYPPTSVQSEEE